MNQLLSSYNDVQSELRTVIDESKIYSRSKKYHNVLEIEIFCGSRPSKDSICLMSIDNYCIVALCLVQEDKAYIADGSNRVVHNREFMKNVESRLGLSVVALEFLQQGGTNQFAAAASLSIEFKRLYVNRLQLTRNQARIRVEPWALRKITESMKQGSKNLEKKGRFNLSDIQYQKCSKCDKKFRTLSRAKITAHERLCRASIISPPSMQ